MPNLCEIANLVITKISVQQETINLKQLQKIIYFSHGFHLLLFREPLVRQKITFNEYTQGIKEITERYSKTFYNWAEMGLAINYSNAAVEQIIDKVIEHYDRLTLVQIYRATRNKTAMDIAKDLDLTSIPNSLIREVFAEEFKIENISELDTLFKIK